MVENIIMNTSCEFHYDNVTVMSVISIIYGHIAAESRVGMFLPTAVYTAV